MRHLPFFALLLVVGGCTTNVVTTEPAPAPGSEAATDTSGDGQEPSAGGSSEEAPEAAKDDRLFPLEVGRKWVYDVTSTYASCPSGKGTFEVVGKVSGSSKKFSARTECGGEGTYTVDGDEVEAAYEWNPDLAMRLLDAKVEDGHSWTTTNGSATFDMTYEKVGALETAAGTFDDCWKVVQQVSYTATWTYCRGVGLVASDLRDLAGGTIETRLKSKSF